MDPYDYDFEPYDDLRRRVWARLLAAFLIVALVLGTGWYIVGLFSEPRGSSLSEGDGAFTELNRPARSVACGTLVTDAYPVDDAPAPEQIPAIQRNVERLRQLEFKEVVSTEFLAPRRVATEIDEINTSTYSERERERDEAIAKMAGMIPEDADIDEILGALSSQVAGFYDPRDGRMVVNSKDAREPLTAASELTLAHELEHALADQWFGLPEEDEIDGPKLDQGLAERSLIEGGATLLQQHYASVAIGSGEAVQILDDPATKEALAELGDIPYPVRRAFEFPYTFGLSFVCELYGEGGWEAVNEAFDNRPTTTAQILFPERYRTQESAWPVRAAEGPPGWTERENASLGAADLLLMFEAPGGAPSRSLSDPLGRAADWVGGRQQLWTEPGRPAEDGLLMMSLIQRDAEGRLCESMQAWYLKAFPGDIVDTGAAVNLAVEGDRDAAILCEDRGVRVAIGPDMETVLSSLGNPTATAAR